VTDWVHRPPKGQPQKNFVAGQHSPPACSSVASRGHDRSRPVRVSGQPSACEEVCVVEPKPPPVALDGPLAGGRMPRLDGRPEGGLPCH
jgi:hypothetical protein